MCREFVGKLPLPLGGGWGEGLATERKHLSPFLFERTEEAKEENLLLQLLNYALTQLSPKGRGSLPTRADTVLDRMRAALRLRMPGQAESQNIAAFTTPGEDQKRGQACDLRFSGIAPPISAIVILAVTSQYLVRDAANRICLPLKLTDERE